MRMRCDETERRWLMPVAFLDLEFPKNIYDNVYIDYRFLCSIQKYYCVFQLTGILDFSLVLS